MRRRTLAKHLRRENCGARRRHTELSVQKDDRRGAMASHSRRTRARLSESDVRLHRLGTSGDGDLVAEFEENSRAARDAIAVVSRRRRVDWRR